MLHNVVVSYFTRRKPTFSFELFPLSEINLALTMTDRDTKIVGLEVNALESCKTHFICSLNANKRSGIHVGLKELQKNSHIFLLVFHLTIICY